jgi:endonuclease YncB( thermonuclease family)
MTVPPPPCSSATLNTRLLSFMRRRPWLMIVGLFASHCAWAYEVQGKVVAIADGDTITVLDAQRQQHKIRLAGIDAPEKKQAFGQTSKKHLSGRVFNRDVVLECGKTDKYQREICVVMVDGQDANLAQVTAGMAWWYRKYQNEQSAARRASYEAAEAAAAAGRVGLWRDAAPVPPWEWRRAKRED